MIATGPGPAAEPRRLHPASMIGRSLQILPQMLVGGAGYGAVSESGRILFFAAIAAGIGLVFAAAGWWRFRYTPGDSEIVIESGLLHRQRRVIPYDRVQDIAIERGPIARVFLGATVKVETGGSSADEGRLDLVPLREAHALRDRIRRWHAAVGEDEAIPEPVAEPVLFAMALPRLLLFGLFSFSLLFLALIFGALQYLDQFDLIDARDWFTSETATSARSVMSLRSGLVLAALVLLLGVVSGLLRTVARDFGYRLTRTETGLRRRRGLFTLSEVVIPLPRVQVAVIESGPVARLLGWYRLSFQTLGADQKEAGKQVAAPFARMAEIAPILAEAGFPDPPPRERFTRVRRRALIRWAGQYLALAVVAAALAFALDPRAGFAAAALFLAALFGLLRWRHHGYALEQDSLFVRDGLLRRTVSVIPVAHVQAIQRTAGPLQRPLRLASLVVDTAGAPLMSPPEVIDLDAREAEALADELLERFRAASARRVTSPPAAATQVA